MRYRIRRYYHVAVVAMIILAAIIGSGFVASGLLWDIPMPLIALGLVLAAGLVIVILPVWHEADEDVPPPH